MTVQHIINQSLIQYDEAKPVINYLLNKTYVQSTRFGDDFHRTIFKFMDKETDEVLLETEVETMSVYYDKLKVWSWSWSQVGLTNAENYLSKEILLYALKLESDLSYIKSILTTSRGVIGDLMQIDINLAIGSNIIKKPYIFPYVYEINGFHLIYYFILLDVDKLDEIKETISKNTTFDK